jgi:hypothetical protein
MPLADAMSTPSWVQGPQSSEHAGELARNSASAGAALRSPPRVPNANFTKLAGLAWITSRM